MDRRGILRGKCLLEACGCSQYELPADSETHCCSYCGDYPAKHLIVQKNNIIYYNFTRLLDQKKIY
jgi:hypothetical protein